MLVAGGLEEGRNQFGINYIWIVPFWLPWLAVLIVNSLPRDPLLVVGGLIEDRPFGRVPDDDGLPQLQGQSRSNSACYSEHMVCDN